MRIDSPTGNKAWLIGKFSGSFKGHLYGLAESASHALYAETASYAVSTGEATTAATASYVEVENVDGLDEKLQNGYLPLEGGTITGSLTVTERLIAEGKLKVKGSLEVIESVHVTGSVYASGNVETEGDIRIRRAILRYDDEDKALKFLFTSLPPIDDDSDEDTGDDEQSSETTSSCSCHCRQGTVNNYMQS